MANDDDGVNIKRLDSMTDQSISSFRVVFLGAESGDRECGRGIEEEARDAGCKIMFMRFIFKLSKGDTYRFCPFHISFAKLLPYAQPEPAILRHSCLSVQVLQATSWPFQHLPRQYWPQ